MTYDDYAERFLAALYLETEDSGSDFHSARSIHEKYGFTPDKSHWISRMADDWEYSYFKKVSKTIGGYEPWSFSISPDGYRKVEAEIGDEAQVRDFLGQSRSGEPKPAETIIRDVVEAEVVPAAGRLVRLNHNQPEYLEIARGLDALYEQVRQDNEIGDTPEERDRLVHSLSAAKDLWSALELRIVQIQVGVVMAVEDASSGLTKVGKAVGAALLVDLIKRFVKAKTGLDF